MRHLLAWTCVLWLALALHAQDSTADCRICQNVHTLPCRQHGKFAERERATGVQHCSVAAECKACAGALAVDCKQCVNGAAEGELVRRQELARSWLDGRRKAIDALTARDPFLHLATTHYELSSTLKPATVGKDKIDQHARLHLYGERLESLRALFLTTLELPDADLPDRMVVVLSEEARDHAILGPRLTSLGPATSVGLKLMGPEYVYSMWADKRSLPDDEAVHRNIVHMVSHLLLSQMKPAMWLGNRQHGWLDEGIAHWFEDKVVGKCTNFCYEEILMHASASFRGGKWRLATRQLVDQGKAVAFGVLAGKNTDQLDFVEHCFAFAYVDWFLAVHGGAKLRDLLRLVKQGKPTREALQQVYGFSPLQIDAPFLSWVKENYSPLVDR